MENTVLIRRRKIILWCGIILSYFTGMAKVQNPGPFFNDLTQMGFGAGAVAALGAGYMYPYSASQLAVGIFSDRWGGVRLLLFGGSFFVAGALLFPLTAFYSSCYPVLFTAKVLSGMGAGTVFLGVTKLIGDLYSERFGLIFGVVMFIGYLGTISGILPTSWLIELVKWRWALLIPALLAAAAMLVLISASPGTVKPIMPGNSFAAIGELLKRKHNWMLFGASSVVFGAYYALLTLAGQKCLMDTYGMSRIMAAGLISGMAVLVALLNPGTSVLLKFCGERRRVPMFFAAICGVTGALLGFASFQWGLPVWCTAAAFVLIAIPAGLFSHYSLIAKELNPHSIGLSISILNFFAFVMIAVVGHSAGLLLNRFSHVAEKSAAGALIYPGAAYRDIFVFFVVLEVIGLVCCFGVPETRQKNS